MSEKNYDDIINLPHHQSEHRKRMKISDRAAQFGSFSALTGHGDAICETARRTEEKHDLDETVKIVLNERLNILYEHINQKPEIAITYFVPDDKKSGGAYVTFCGSIKKLDTYRRILVSTDETIIPIDDILSIDGEIFEDFTD